MRIAFFTDTYLPNIDGVVISITNTKHELEKMGHKVFVFAPSPSIKIENGKNKKNKEKDTFLYPAIPFIPYPQYKLAFFTYGIREILKRKKIDIIHSHGMGPMGMAALYCAKRTKKPIVGTLHTNIQEATHYITKIKKAQKFLKNVAWQYLRLYYNECDAVIVPSEYMKKECERHGIKNVCVIPNGIYLERFLGRKGREKEGKRREIREKEEKREKEENAKLKWKNNIVVLYVGRLVREKNLDVVIKAAKLLEREGKIKVGNKYIHFVIVGGGPAEEYYKSLTTKYKVGHLFTFVGRVEHEEVVKYYRNADVFVFPSKFETQGLSGIEAMACGLPVAGARFLAIPDIVKDGFNGYLFSPNSAKDCMRALLLTIKNKKRLRKNAIKTAKKYSVEKCTQQHLSLYNSLINQ